jgi:DNA-binding NtrC family response regulator
VAKSEDSQPGAPQETAPLSQTSRERIGKVVGTTMALVVYHRDGAEVVPLRRGVPLVIGREAPADVVISDGSLSRLHARFLVDGGALSVEDLGSTNGTRVRGKLVERAVLRPGEPVALGTVMVSAQAQSPLETPLDGLDSHDRFTSALAEAVGEARYFGEALSVMMIRAEGEGADHVSRWCRRVRAVMRPVDRMALYSDDIVEVLLPRLAMAAAAERAVALREAVGRRSPLLLIGVAAFPEAGTTAERLVERARAALLEASPAAPIARAPSEVAYTLASSDDVSDDVPIARNPAMRELFHAVDRVAQAMIPVLICGETGTGKEVVARAIHERGPRRERPFLCVNCGAIVAQLVESTLFGHTRGAFTGADVASPGVFGAADGGTVLLDEIGELPKPAQVALLRVLEAGRMARVGSPEEVAVDVRVLAATHRDLEAMCAEGRFRRDLLYRLNAVTLSVPPLRERSDEIRTLTERFLRAAMRSARREQCRISPEAMRALERYRWPGNLRELRNTVERAVVIARGDCIELEDLPPRVAGGRDGERPTLASDALDDAGLDLRSRVRHFEAWAIREGLRAEAGNRTHAAKRLGIPLRTLLDKMRRLSITDVEEAHSIPPTGGGGSSA